jgi:hypothetical protein
MDYVMELCETCDEPIGYMPFMTEGNAEHPAMPTVLINPI